MKPLKLTIWPALALCLMPVCAHATLVTAHRHRPMRNVVLVDKATQTATVNGAAR